MKYPQPFRKTKVYSAACVGCGEEIESATLPVPLYCVVCKAQRPGVAAKGAAS